MGALALNNQSLESIDKQHQHEAVVVDEVKGIVKLFKDGHVERYPIVPHVACRSNLDPNVTCGDVVIDSCNGVWARIYVPKHLIAKLPILIYFHGGGFCVGSAAWKCYHEFLLRLAGVAGCLVMSVNYRLAPENRLPAAFDDGVAAVKWVGQHSGEESWWGGMCDFSKVYIAGDSAGGCLAHNVMLRLSSSNETIDSPNEGLSEICIKGMILIQPFFGGEERTWSEKNMRQPPNSALTLSAADAYWRLALPVGSTRDHPWCNPWSTTEASKNLESLCLPPVLVFVSELDILKDRNIEFCSAMKGAGKKVELVIHVGVGHAFQILHSSPTARARREEIILQISSFVNKEFDDQ